MSDVAIEVERLSKQYRLGELNQYPMLREALARAATWPIRALRSRAWSGQAGSTPREIWALRDVSFEVRRGEVLGIIGRNGAGKSTLLKILSGITEPTSGHADINGRVGTLLEVGTGFHMELTGRENIFLNGALLGMGRAEIKRKFDDIVEFSEVEQYLDTPVKRYSSGMYMRLAFAVAAHLEPEILIVDEVLSVGDAAFQRKCLGKMGEVARDGRTVLFVSHNMSTVQALCDRIVWLEAGQVRSEGPTAEMVKAYLESAAQSEAGPLADRVDRQGDGSVRLQSIQIKDADGGSLIRTGSRLKVTVTYASDRPVRNLRVYCSIYDLGHVGIYALDSDAVGGLPELLPATGTLTCITDPVHVTPGRCYATLALLKGGSVADRVPQAVYIDVEPGVDSGTGLGPTRDWVLCTLPHSWFASDVHLTEVAAGEVGR